MLMIANGVTLFLSGTSVASGRTRIEVRDKGRTNRDVEVKHCLGL